MREVPGCICMRVHKYSFSNNLPVSCQAFSLPLSLPNTVPNIWVSPLSPRNPGGLGKLPTPTGAGRSFMAGWSGPPTVPRKQCSSLPFMLQQRLARCLHISCCQKWNYPLDVNPLCTLTQGVILRM